jgi:hypothetical protein
MHHRSHIHPKQLWLVSVAPLCGAICHFKPKDLLDRKIHSMVLMLKEPHHLIVKPPEVVIWLDRPVGVVFRVCQNGSLGRNYKPKTGGHYNIDPLRR